MSKRERGRKRESSSGGLFPRQPVGNSSRTAEEEEFEEAVENMSFRPKTPVSGSVRTPMGPPKPRPRLRRPMETSYRDSN